MGNRTAEMKGTERTGKRVLVCGGRAFADRHYLFSVLDGIHRAERIKLIIHGAAPGADSLAEAWAKSREIPYVGVPAQWKRIGRSAGPQRNDYMLAQGSPDMVIAFPGDKGTADMTRRAAAAGVKIVAAGLDDRERADRSATG